MIATSEIEYPPGKKWTPGDRFPVEDDHTNVLNVTGKARFPTADDDPADPVDESSKDNGDGQNAEAHSEPRTRARRKGTS